MILKKISDILRALALNIYLHIYLQWVEGKYHTEGTLTTAPPTVIKLLLMHLFFYGGGNFMYMSFRAHNSLSVCQEELERAVK